MRKPRALRPGDRIAVVAPASAFARADFDAGVTELRALGFDPVYDESVFERRAYAAGSAATRAAAFERAWRDPDIAALIAVRGGYGSVHLLPLLEASLLAGPPKGVHRLQRQHVPPVVAHARGPGGVVSRSDARGAPGARRGGLRSRHVHALPLPRGTRGRNHASAARGAPLRRGVRHADWRDALAAVRVARHAVRVRSADGVRPVHRRRGRASVPARSHADPVVSERHSVTRLGARVR